MSTDGSSTKTYENIDRPYGDLLERDSELIVNTGGNVEESTTNSTDSAGTTKASSDSSSNTSATTVTSEQSLSNIWIDSFIRSKNWKPKVSGFTINGETGYAEFTNIYVSGTIIATTGVFGGWTISGDTLTADSIILDAGNEQIVIGNPSAIVIDGQTGSIESSNYVSGVFGTGFHLDSNLLEVGNIAARGLIRTAVFQKDVISAVGGNLVVLDGDVLSADMSATDNSTLTIEGNTSFAIGDILRIKDGASDEWMEVTAINLAPTYTVTRDRAGSYTSNNNPAWTKGASVVNYKQSGDGGIYMTASESNAPYLSIFDHLGSPWSAINTRLRIGNLNGYLGYNTDLYGIAIGETDAYLKYDPTNGLRIKGDLNATTGYIGGWEIDTNTIKDTSGGVGLSSEVTSGNDIRFWAGTNEINKNNAPFRVDENGNIVVESLRRRDFHWFTMFESLDGYLQTIVNTGTGGNSLTVGAGGITSAVGNGANSYNEVSKFATSGDINGFSWDKQRSVTTCLFSPTSSFRTTIGCGDFTSWTSTKIGFRFESGHLYGDVANGSSNTAVDLGSIASGTSFFNYTFVYIPTESVIFYVNDTQVGICTTNLPTGIQNAEKIFYFRTQSIDGASPPVKTAYLTMYDFWQANYVSRKEISSNENITIIENISTSLT